MKLKVESYIFAPVAESKRALLCIHNAIAAFHGYVEFDSLDRELLTELIKGNGFRIPLHGLWCRVYSYNPEANLLVLNANVFSFSSEHINSFVKVGYVLRPDVFREYNQVVPV